MNKNQAHSRKAMACAVNVSLCAIALSLSANLSAQPVPPPSTLPVRQITLFSSGVAYTERSGLVDGTATVPLIFRTQQIDDILKSMVLIDHGGKVQPATYASRDPIGKTLQGFAVDVSEDLSQSDLLGKLRGARVAVETPGKPNLEGQIIGVEERQVRGDNAKPVTASFINVLTDSGLTSVRLDTDRTVRILDDRLARELHEALSTLATGSDTQRRQVTLHFSGAGKREVRVAYVMEAPIWKISYRLVLGAEVAAGSKAAPAAKPYLQGWAIVENTTEEDWRNVRLSLVSGRPVSFIQDLYQPLYIPRPTVGPDVVASPYPQTHDENLLARRKALGEPVGMIEDNNEMSFGPDTSANASVKVDLDLNNYNLYYGLRLLFSHIKSNFTIDESVKSQTVTVHFRQLPFRVALETMLKSSTAPLTYKVENGIYSVIPKVEEAAQVAEMAVAATPRYRDGADGELAFGEAQQSIRAQASGARAGEMFKYSITTPINLPRQQAAMIPVIAQDIGADRLSIYNADQDGRFAMNAIRIRNNTSLYLKGGPITLFDGGTYAGDAKIEDVPPGDTRLVSYAVDLSMLCDRRTPGASSIKARISLKRGLFTESRSEQNETIYTLKSRATKPRTVLVEHPLVNGYNLISPAKAAERTVSVYRFSVVVPPGESRTLKVVTERPLSTTTALSNMGIARFLFYISGASATAKQKSELHEIVRQRKVVEELKARSSTLTYEISSINDDQERIRKNMEALDKSSALYKRYVAKLDAQETHIQANRKEAARLDRLTSAANQALLAYEDKLSD